MLCMWFSCVGVHIGSLEWARKVHVPDMLGCVTF